MLKNSFYVCLFLSCGVVHGDKEYCRKALEGTDVRYILCVNCSIKREGEGRRLSSLEHFGLDNN